MNLYQILKCVFEISTISFTRKASKCWKKDRVNVSNSVYSCTYVPRNQSPGVGLGLANNKHTVVRLYRKNKFKYI